MHTRTHAHNRSYCLAWKSGSFSSGQSRFSIPENIYDKILNTTHGAAFTQNFQSESDRASRFNDKLTGIMEDRRTRSTTSGDAVGKTRTVGNSSGQMSQFLMQINCQEKKKREAGPRKSMRHTNQSQLVWILFEFRAQQIKKIKPSMTGGNKKFKNGCYYEISF